MIKRSGFTLAEVLITLGVIGVVAAMTIPTLINNYQKQQYVAGLKKAYSQMLQATKLIALQDGCNNDLECTGLFSSSLPWGEGPKAIGEAYARQLKATKICGTDTSHSDCWANLTNINVDGSGEIIPINKIGNYKFVTADGMSYIFFSEMSDCGEDSLQKNTLGHMKNVCGYIWVDVNGVKKPNVFGKDTFYFYLTNGKGAFVYPQGGIETGTGYWNRDGENNCSPAAPLGMPCAGRIIEEGWQMNY